MGPHGYNQNYPFCRNPWNPDYIPCGSSSGSGVSVGGRMVYGSLGSDTGGSIRCPAAVSGVVGLLPTYGRVSVGGVVPLSWSLDHVGPICRTTTDTALMLEAIAGYDPGDTCSMDWPVERYSQAMHARTTALRVGVVRRVFFDQIDAHEQFVDARGERRTGHSVEPAVELEQLAPAQPVVEAEVLGQESQLGTRVAVAERRAEHGGVPRARGHQPEQHLQRRRLARTVRAEIAEDVATVDRQVDVVDGNELPVALDETARDNRRRVGHAKALAAASASEVVIDPPTMTETPS